MLSEQEGFLFEALKSIVARALKARNTRKLAEAVYEFAEHLQNPLIQRIIQQMEREYFAEYEQYNIEAKKAAEVLTPICREVLLYLQQQKDMYDKVNAMSLHILTADISTYTHSVLRVCELNKIIMPLYQDANKQSRSFAQKFIHLDSFERVAVIPFVDMQHLEEEVSYLDRIQSTSAWYSVHKILSFVQIYNPKVCKIQRVEYEEAQRPLDLLILDVRYKGLDNAINPNKDTAPYEGSFDLEHYPEHLERVYHYIASALFDLKNQEQDISRCNRTSINNRELINPIVDQVVWYDALRKILHIGEYKIKFKGRGKINAILTAITKHKPLTYTWSWDEIYTALEKREPAKMNAAKWGKYKRSLYYSYDNINEQISKQSGGRITCFLKFGMNEVYINPDIFSSL